MTKHNPTPAVMNDNITPAQQRQLDDLIAHYDEMFAKHGAKSAPTNAWELLKHKLATANYPLIYRYTAMAVVALAFAYVVYRMALTFSLAPFNEALAVLDVLPLMHGFGVLLFMHTLNQGGYARTVAIVLTVVTAVLI